MRQWAKCGLDSIRQLLHRFAASGFYDAATAGAGVTVATAATGATGLPLWIASGCMLTYLGLSLKESIKDARAEQKTQAAFEILRRRSRTTVKELEAIGFQVSHNFQDMHRRFTELEGLIQRRDADLDEFRAYVQHREELDEHLTNFFANNFNELQAVVTELPASIDGLYEELKPIRAGVDAANRKLDDLHAPTLYTPLAQIDQPIDRFKFNTRAVPLLGRDRELHALNAYLGDDRRLLWWLWVGDGGVGKSRLMLELVLAAEQRGWNAGFLRSDDVFAPGRWQPQHDTLIVVDYVATRAEQVRDWITAFHARADTDLEHKVRFVLLERSAGETDQWYRTFCSTGSTQTELNNRQYQPPRALHPPDEESVWGVFVHVAHAAADNSRPASDVQLADLKPNFLQRIRERPVQQRPLFAMFAGELVAQRGTQSFGQWDSDTLVRLVLEREIDQRWRGRVDRAHVNLLVLATLAGGLIREQAYAAVASLPGLPDRDALNLDTYRILTGFDTDPDGRELPPLLPDLLGECFLLERLAGRCAVPGADANPDAVRAGAEQALAWARSSAPLETAGVIMRAVQDFPRHESVPVLLRCPEAHSEVWHLVAAHGVGAGIDPQLSDELLRMLEQSGASAGLRAAALYNRGVTHGQFGNFEAAIADYSTVIDMPDAPAEQKAIALYNLGVTYYRLRNPKAEIAVYSAVIDMPDAPAEQKARALVNRGITHGQLGNHEAAIADFAAVIDMTDAPAEQKARALVNRGASHGKLDNLKAAIADLTAIIAMPDAPAEQKAEALVNRGITYYRLRNPKAEIADYSAVIDMPGATANEKVKALLYRGVAHGKLGNLQAEIADYTAVIDMPDAPAEQKAKALYNRGVAHGQLGDTEAKIADYSAVIEMPDAPAEQKAQALLYRGVTQGKLGDTEAKIADYTAVIDMPDAPAEAKARGLLLLGAALVDLGKQDEGTSKLEQAVAAFREALALFEAAGKGDYAAALARKALEHAGRLLDERRGQ